MFSEKNVSYIYSIMLFSKMAYYLSRLSIGVDVIVVKKIYKVKKYIRLKSI